MTSKYFTLPSFARSNQHKEDTSDTVSQEPVLKEEDEKFLEQHIANDKAPSGLQNVTATKISDEGEEKEASMQEQVQADHPTDQAVIPETQPGAEGVGKAEEERPYDDVMKEKAAERVKARKAKKRRTLDLPSQEEAEAATRGFTVESSPNTEAAQSEKRTWTSYLSSLSYIRPSSKQSNQSDKETSDDSSTLRAWKDYASSYVPASWMPNKDKTPEARPSSPVYNEDGTIDEEKTREKEEREVSALLDKLSLSQINNRVFSFSGETQKIYERFAQVLKDTINGAPTAYDDMDKLMREAGPKLEQQFKAMPPFVQTLVKSLPAKIGATLGPEILAATSEKPGADLQAELDAGGRPGTADSGINIPSGESDDKKKKKKKKRRIPGLRSLLSKEGAVASMLRNVVNFLQARFPFLASTTSVAMSLAVFILMFVFWYCHKRGKEVRLAKEAEDAAAVEELGEEEDDTAYDDDDDDDDEPLENDEKYQAMLKDVEAKASTLNQPNPTN